MKFCIGIDNGLDGGISTLSLDNKILRRVRMPTKKVGKGREVCPIAFAAILSEFPVAESIVAIEEPLRHAKSSQAMRSMAYSFGLCVGVATTLGYKVEVTSVQKWQEAILGKVPKGLTKRFALAAATKLWPDENFLATPRSTTPHDGIIDAALIAYFTNK
jgi:hypothetical protein